MPHDTQSQLPSGRSSHLAAALGQLGRMAEASKAVEELRRRRPGLTPVRRSAVSGHIIAAGPSISGAVGDPAPIARRLCTAITTRIRERCYKGHRPTVTGGFLLAALSSCGAPVLCGALTLRHSVIGGFSLGSHR